MSDKSADEQGLRDKLAEYLSRARTDKEVASKFGNEALAEMAKLGENPPKGYKLKEGRNEYQEKTSYLEKKEYAREIRVAKRIFGIRASDNDPDYLSVAFPPDLDFTKEKGKNALRIVPFDTVHFSDHLCDEDRFREYLQYVEKKPYAFAFLNGDIIGGHGYDEDTAPEIRDRLKRLLAPVSHKILWAQSGPLERKMAKIDGIEPLQAVCRELGIHHTARPVRADVSWKQPAKPIEFYAFHGRSQARKDGSKINAILDAVIGQNFPHFTVMGHVKEGMAHNLTVRRLNPVQFKIVEHSAYAIVCPGFLKHEGSEGELKGYPPPAVGSVVCIIDADNNHHASS